MTSLNSLEYAHPPPRDAQKSDLLSLKKAAQYAIDLAKLDVLNDSVEDKSLKEALEDIQANLI